MIVTRSPLRVSFLGGGSDYKEFFSKESGYVLGSSINQYVYVTLMKLPKFAEENYRFTYRVTESVDRIFDFKHPVIKTSLSAKDWKESINVATMADLPGRSGLGSSSSFTVALELALATYKKIEVDPYKLAMSAIEIERDILREPGGYQDQFQASFGGLNLYEFSSNGVRVHPNNLKSNILSELSNSLVLAPVKKWRDSGEFAANTVKAISKTKEFQIISEMAGRARATFDFINEANSYADIIHRLSSEINWGWEQKIWLSGGTIDKKVIQLIERGIAKGALAGRMCGAGGTGFILFLVDSKNRESFTESFKAEDPFPISIENRGCRVVLDESNEI